MAGYARWACAQIGRHAGRPGWQCAIVDRVTRKKLALLTCYTIIPTFVDKREGDIYQKN